MKKLIEKAQRRAKRKLRIRSIVKGSAERPRLSVFASNKHFYCQAIDDLTGKTLASVSDLEKTLTGTKINIEGVKALGLEFGKRLKAKKIDLAVFDRNGFRYHGVIKSFADAVREAGVKF
jgi:large subunit ribosomal protein L18